MSLSISKGELDQQLDDYQVIYSERSDPFGTVFKGKQEKLRKPVNLRVLPISADELAQEGNDFQEHFAICASFQHQNLSEIIDFGVTESGLLYVVTPMCGKSLRTVENINVGQFKGLFLDLLRVTGWLHDSSNLHGWINPYLLGIDDNGLLKLDGFGLAGLADLLRPRF